MRTDALTLWVSSLFIKTGIAETAAPTVAASLVAADLEGVASHGVMLVPMYLDRLAAGSVSKKTNAEIVYDSRRRGRPRRRQHAWPVELEAGDRPRRRTGEEARPRLGRRQKRFSLRHHRLLGTRARRPRPRRHRVQQHPSPDAAARRGRTHRRQQPSRHRFSFRRRSPSHRHGDERHRNGQDPPRGQRRAVRSPRVGPPTPRAGRPPTRPRRSRECFCPRPVQRASVSRSPSISSAAGFQGARSPTKYSRCTGTQAALPLLAPVPGHRPGRFRHRKPARSRPDGPAENPQREARAGHGYDLRAGRPRARTARGERRRMPGAAGRVTEAEGSRQRKLT